MLNKANNLSLSCEKLHFQYCASSVGDRNCGFHHRAEARSKSGTRLGLELCARTEAPPRDPPSAGVRSPAASSSIPPGQSITTLPRVFAIEQFGEAKWSGDEGKSGSKQINK